MGADVVPAVRSVLASGSEADVVENAGHFLHLEQPAEVNARVLGFLTS
jgi:pimeloyl-ACP methyl ester carboxylesterase